MRRVFERTVVERVADFLYRGVYWLRCTLSTGHDPDLDFAVPGGGPYGKTICNSCGCWVPMPAPRSRP